MSKILPRQLPETNPPPLVSSITHHILSHLSNTNIIMTLAGRGPGKGKEYYESLKKSAAANNVRADRNNCGRDGPIGRVGHGTSRPVVKGSRGLPWQPSSRRRYVCPDRNRSAFLPDTICDACRRPGHVAATCDVLAKALFIEKYKRDISGDLKDKLERDWISRWKDTVGSHRPPCRVMNSTTSYAGTAGPMTTTCRRRPTTAPPARLD